MIDKKIKGAYFLFWNPHDNKDGINKKILGQIKAMRNAGFSVDEITLKRRLFGQEIRNESVFKKALVRMPFISSSWSDNVNYEKYDFIYMRRPPFMNGKFIKKLRNIKRINPKIIVIIEIPTFPYDYELWRRKIDWPLGIKEVIARKSLHKYVDALTEVTNEGKIFGIKTVQLDNGIDYECVSIRNPIVDEKIDLLCIAVFQFWHGYERLIESVKRYYKSGGKRNVMVHMVGDGPELDYYKTLCRKYSIDDRFTFYGRLGGEELQKVYDIADLGICGLGEYKVGIFHVKELKSREYAASGLPMITCCDLNLNNDHIEKYMHKIPNSEVIFDLNEIITFYDSLGIKNDIDSSRVAEELRSVSKTIFDINIANKPLIDYIENKVKGQK